MFKITKEIIRDNIKYRNEIYALAMMNVKNANKGSDLGRVWAVLRPGIFILGMWFAMVIGFRSGNNIKGTIVPYFVWLMTGMVPWFYIRDNITGGSTCFKRNRSIMLKTPLPSTIIPTIQAVQVLSVHLWLVGITILVAVLMGVRPCVYWLQLPVYMGLMVLYVIIWGFFSGCLTVLSKDFGNVMASITPMFMWLSGIMFDTTNRGKNNPLFKLIFDINPITFLVEGYRNALCREVWFFNQPRKMAYFLASMMLFYVMGMLIYRRLRRKLPDIV